MARPATRADDGREGSGPSAPRIRTLRDTMREPSTVSPGVVVLDSMDPFKDSEESVDPKEDLWLTSADGRYSSPMISLHVGEAPDDQTFEVHRDILLRVEVFKKGLSGGFMETKARAIELPDEKPSIFHFIVAWLYEKTFVPILPAATVLDGNVNLNEKSRADGYATLDSHSSSSESSVSHDSRRVRRQRSQANAPRDGEQRKHPGSHRPDCACRQCESRLRDSVCWRCFARRSPPRQTAPHNAGPARPPPSPPHNAPRHEIHPEGNTGTDDATANEGYRIQGQDLQTWLLTYELAIDVYICAHKFLMKDLKAAVARVCIDLLESAGEDAADIQVLLLCQRLHAGVPESDRLLRMVSARVGFLYPALNRRAPDETTSFLAVYPEVSILMFTETLRRREKDTGGRLPPMEPVTRPAEVGPARIFPLNWNHRRRNARHGF